MAPPSPQRLWRHHRSALPTRTSATRDEIAYGRRTQRWPLASAIAWRAILARLMNAEPDDGFSSDDFLGLPEVVSILDPGDAAAAGRSVLRILVAMQKARLLSTGMRMTAFVRLGVAIGS